MLRWTLVLSCVAASIAGWSPPVEPQAPPAGTPKIPLRVGLTIITAVSESQGDYESIKQIVAVSDQGYTLTYAADVPEDEDINDPSTKNQVRQVRTRRTVRAEDLRSARDYSQHFSDAGPEVYPGSTALGASTAVLTDLKSKGQSPFSVFAGGLGAVLGNLMQGALGGGGKPPRMSGALTRVPGPCSVSVLVRGTPSQLPCIRARGELTGSVEDGTAELWFLDDPDHPIALRWVIGDGDTLQVVRIEFPDPPQPVLTGPAAPAPGTGRGLPSGTSPTASGGGGGGAGAGGAGAAAGGAGRGSGSGGGAPAIPPTTSAKTIEKALNETGKFVIYGIYFDFASDRIKPESEPVLNEIAQVLASNPAWALSVNGHTDNVGGQKYNLDLSQRRAAAVKQALVTRYKVTPDRLTTAGFGLSSPVDRNDTIEGRARNRRVELIKR